MNPRHEIDKQMVEFLRKLVPGERVHYKDWRGGTGEGVFLRHIDPNGRTVDSRYWGNHKKDGLIIKRDFSADEGRVFRPFLDDGDVINTDVMIAHQVMES